MQDRTPLVSVTICCYNSERYIVQTVQSVLDQTFGDFELIIVNDGSTDCTEEIVRSFGDPRIRYEYQQNRGLAATRNRTLELARGKYIAFLDHDDLWVREKLALQIPLMEMRDDVAVSYGNAANIDGEGNVILERYTDFFKPRDGDVFADLLIEGDFINWQTVVIRRSVLDRVGGFRAYKIAEDYDMLLRCAVDHTFVGMDYVLAQYRRHAHNYGIVRMTQDSNHLHHRTMERWDELLEITEYWLANLPPRHKELLPALQRKIAKLHYDVGKYLCLQGDTRAGRAHLQKAWPESSSKWRAGAINILAGLLGSRFYPRVYRAFGAVLRTAKLKS